MLSFDKSCESRRKLTNNNISNNKLKFNSSMDNNNPSNNIQKTTSLSCNNNITSTTPSSSIIMTTAKKMSIKSISSPTTISSDINGKYPFENLYCQCKHHITN